MFVFPEDCQQLLLKADVPSQQRNWGSSLDQEDPEPSPIKEEQQELWTSQEGERPQHLEEVYNTKATRFEDVKDLFKQQLLTAARDDLIGHFNSTISEYEKELSRQQKLLDVVLKPEIKQRRAGVSHESYRCFLLVRTLIHFEIMRSKHLLFRAKLLFIP